MNKKYCDMCNKEVNESFLSDSESYLIHPTGSSFNYKFIDICYNCQRELYKFIKLKSKEKLKTT